MTYTKKEALNAMMTKTELDTLRRHVDALYVELDDAQGTVVIGRSVYWGIQDLKAAISDFMNDVR